MTWTMVVECREVPRKTSSEVKVGVTASPLCTGPPLEGRDPFKWYQSLYLHFTHAKMSITHVVIEYWIGCDGFMVIKHVAIYKCCIYVYKCCEYWQSL